MAYSTSTTEYISINRSQSKTKLTIEMQSLCGVKPSNDDCFLAAKPMAAQSSIKGQLFAVADGVSHANRAAEASWYCLNELRKSYFSSATSWSTQRAISQSLQMINSQLYSRTDRHGTNIKFGEQNFERTSSNEKEQWLSTLSCAVLKGKKAHIFHVGDSQVGVVRDGHFKRLTKPHNSHLGGHSKVLTRAMGADSHLQVDYSTFPIQPGDILIFSTDGVHEFVSEPEIIEAVSSEADLNQAVQRITQIATANHSDDNLTCLLVRIDSLAQSEEFEFEKLLASKKIPRALSSGSIIDDFKIIEVLHETPRSHLYLAVDKDNDQTQPTQKYAVKIPSINFEDDKEYLQRFIRESWVSQLIASPQVLKVLPLNQNSPFLYQVYEYVEGQTLRQWIDDNPNPNINSVRKIVDKISKALRLFKRLDIVHGDIKPDNIMLDESNEDIKIIDFGDVSIASLDELINDDSAPTAAGTINYLAPEVIHTFRSSHQSDLFSLGVVAYEMLTGSLPYPDLSDMNKHRVKNVKLHYQSAKDKRQSLPFWIDLALKKATEPDPGLRYDTYSEFVTDLSRPHSQIEEIYFSRPLIERDPVKFWRTTSAVLALLLVFTILL
ncbi:MAG: protein kinase [Kangiellaceae bacterium]|nr:protein kinase [Kangiellaceae bacterium]MCW8997454.1 protein kinase [Kangiellaceae bacterium]MCW9016409.1 protein kinase [Kangiellaceae bacterium]